MLLTDREAAKELGLKVPTLRFWRMCGRGPKFIRMGRAVRYSPTDLMDYIKAQTVEPLSSDD